MPTPYGSRGGMAFSADELRVLRGALAVAHHSQPATREYADLAEAVDDVVREGGRLRTFLLADLARYRDALPGSAPGYLAQLQDALGAGYLPRPDDLAALRSLVDAAAGEAESVRRTALLDRCERLAGQAVRARLLSLPAARSADEPVSGVVSGVVGDAVAGCFPDGESATDGEDAADGESGARGQEAEEVPPPADEPPAGPADEPPADPADEPPADPADEPADEPVPAEDPPSGPAGDPAAEPPSRPAADPSGDPPAEPGPQGPDASPPVAPGRPVPTPAEVFPPRRHPVPPPEEALSA